MPIVVNYEPAASVIGDAAFQGGLGEYRTRQQQLALQAAQIAQQDQHFQQQLAANLYSQQQQQLANQASQVFQANRQAGILGYQRQN